MGRPLYSRAFQTTTTPAIREPEEPSYGRWSYLNAFDPDSDEFFDNENAVYEDIIGPVTAVNPTAGVSMDDEDDEEERDMLVVRMGNASPISTSSESSLSDSDSPLADGADDPVHLVVDAFHDAGRIIEAEQALEEPAVRVRLATRTLPREARRASQTAELERSHLRRGHATTGVIRPVSYAPYPQRGESLAVPTPSAPIPVPVVSRRYVPGDDRALPLPTTPPRQTPITHFPMSPPPTSTPRLYSWARNPSHPASPSSNGPFTNPHARTSYTHLSPAFIRIRDVTV